MFKIFSLRSADGRSLLIPPLRPHKGGHCWFFPLRLWFPPGVGLARVSVRRPSARPRTCGMRLWASCWSRPRGIRCPVDRAAFGRFTIATVSHIAIVAPHRHRSPAFPRPRTAWGGQPGGARRGGRASSHRTYPPPRRRLFRLAFSAGQATPCAAAIGTLSHPPSRPPKGGSPPPHTRPRSVPEGPSPPLDAFSPAHTPAHPIHRTRVLGRCRKVRHRP